MKQGKKLSWKNFPISILLAVSALICIVPFWLVLVSSLTPEADIISYGYSLIPRRIDFTAYKILLADAGRILNGYKISIFVTVVGTVLSVAVITLAAYPISQDRVKYHRALNFFVLFTMLFNGGLVPTYIMYTRYLHFKNTFWALIIPGLLMNAINVILVRTFLQSNVPISLLEAARIDGAGEFKIFRKVVLPLAKPIVATVGLFIGVAYWNDWTNGLYYVTDAKLFSVQQMLNNMLKNIEYLSNNPNSQINTSNIAASVPQASVRMAIALVGILPILVIYPFVQKYFVKGIAIGAVKG